MDETAKLKDQIATLRRGNEVIVEINQYWLYRCGEAERECRRLRERLKRLTKKVMGFTEIKGKQDER